MRISMLAGDPGYWQHPLKVHANYVTVTLDGVPVKDCVTADEEQGLVFIYRRDADGKLVHDGVEVLMEERRGVVKITPFRMADGRWPHPGVPEPAE